MRIVSQDNLIDLPYEDTALTINGGYIHAQFGTLSVKMARYKDNETAKEALMCLLKSYSTESLSSNVFKFPE